MPLVGNTLGNTTFGVPPLGTTFGAIQGPSISQIPSSFTSTYPTIGLPSVNIIKTPIGSFSSGSIQGIGASISQPIMLGQTGFNQIGASGMAMPPPITQSFVNKSIVQRNQGESDNLYYQREFNIKGSVISVSEPKIVSTNSFNSASSLGIANASAVLPSSSLYSGTQGIVLPTTYNNPLPGSTIQNITPTGSLQIIS